MVINELTAIRTLIAAVTTATYITHQRDPETGTHLERMSRYARLIAKTLAPRYQLNDEYIEHVFMFSPLHNIGKIGIPDHILLKQRRLTQEETAIMRTHAGKGSRDDR
jgi:response regulator RpfG family c-di-GMP phosphodiesterase